MTRNAFRAAWAAPAIALTLLATPAGSRRAEAAPRPALLQTMAAKNCLLQAAAFAAAVTQWYKAWDNYQMSLPNGTESEILEAAQELDQAAQQVATTGSLLSACLFRYL
ncbi:MAG TPA: hypothetical protein VFK78_08385 [Gemmatimonadales bacterium]|nr:hypothetical protein [Gemmatimonadales bacterium]